MLCLRFIQLLCELPSSGCKKDFGLNGLWSLLQGRSCVYKKNFEDDVKSLRCSTLMWNARSCTSTIGVKTEISTESTKVPFVICTGGKKSIFINALVGSCMAAS